MVLRVRPTPTRFPTNGLYTRVDKHTLAFYIKCVPPVGRTLAYQPFDPISEAVDRLLKPYLVDPGQPTDENQ